MTDNGYLNIRIVEAEVVTEVGRLLEDRMFVLMESGRYETLTGREIDVVKDTVAEAFKRFRELHYDPAPKPDDTATGIFQEESVAQLNRVADQMDRG